MYNGTVERDEHLWKMADSNQDGRLNEEEFLPFQHPEHSTVTVSHQYVMDCLHTYCYHTVMYVCREP